MNIMNAMMLSCVKATELMEMKGHVPLGLVKTMQLNIHTAMCSGCRNYMKQAKLIDELLRRTFETTPVVADTNELEAAIISKLQ